MSRFIPFAEGWPIYLAVGRWSMSVSADPKATLEDMVDVLRAEWAWQGWAACHVQDPEIADMSWGAWLEIDRVLRKIGRIPE
jgi:hypothetical protein